MNVELLRRLPFGLSILITLFVFGFGRPSVANFGSQAREVQGLNGYPTS